MVSHIDALGDAPKFHVFAGSPSPKSIRCRVAWTMSSHNLRFLSSAYIVLLNFCISMILAGLITFLTVGTLWLLSSCWWYFSLRFLSDRRHWLWNEPVYLRSRSERSGRGTYPLCFQSGFCDGHHTRHLADIELSRSLQQRFWGADRQFMFKVNVSYPTKRREKYHQQDDRSKRADCQKVISPARIMEIRSFSRTIYADEKIEIMWRTSSKLHGHLMISGSRSANTGNSGASPRGR